MTKPDIERGGNKKGLHRQVFWCPKWKLTPSWHSIGLWDWRPHRLVVKNLTVKCVTHKKDNKLKTYT